MLPPVPSAKDPTAGFMLSIILPGLGFAYAGDTRKFVTFLAIEGVLLYMDSLLPLAAVHFFQAIAAAGAVKQWNLEPAAGPGADTPAPPAPGTRKLYPPLTS